MIATRFARPLGLLVVGAGLIGAAALGPGGIHTASNPHADMGFHSRINSPDLLTHGHDSGGRANTDLVLNS